MDPVLASLSQLLAIQTTILNRAVASLTDEEAWRRPTEHTNSVGWMLGHITLYRNRLLAALGGEIEPTQAWEPLFQRGAQLADRAAYPATEQLVATLKRINEKVRARMEASTDAELSAPCPLPSPAPDKTVRGVVGFLVFHDGYHLGQVSYAVKILGKPGLVG